MKKYFLYLLFLAFLGVSSVYAKDPDWDNFVENFKNTESMILFQESAGDVGIISTDNTLEIELEKNMKTKFLYENGIISYVLTNDDDTVIQDSLFIENCLETIANIKHYDVDKLSNYIENNNDLSLAKDGIEYEIETINIKDENSSMSYTKVKSFKLDIKNGIKTFNTVPNVTNPETGISNKYVGIISLLGVGVLALIKSKKYNSFPQA